jgi:hypothetical protein
MGNLHTHTVGTAMSGNTKFFSGTPQMKRPSGTSIYRWKNNIKNEVKERGRQQIEWIQLVKDRLKWVAFVDKILTVDFHNNQASYVTINVL